MLTTFVVLLIMILMNEQIASIFTTDEEVIEVVKSTLWVLVVYIFFDGIHGVQAGIIRGLGK